MLSTTAGQRTPAATDSSKSRRCDAVARPKWRAALDYIHATAEAGRRRDWTELDRLLDPRACLEKFGILPDDPIVTAAAQGFAEEAYEEQACAQSRTRPRARRAASAWTRRPRGPRAVGRPKGSTATAVAASGADGPPAAGPPAPWRAEFDALRGELRAEQNARRSIETRLAKLEAARLRFHVELPGRCAVGWADAARRFTNANPDRFPQGLDRTKLEGRVRRGRDPLFGRIRRVRRGLNPDDVAHVEEFLRREHRRVSTDVYEDLRAPKDAPRAQSVAARTSVL